MTTSENPLFVRAEAIHEELTVLHSELRQLRMKIAAAPVQAYDFRRPEARPSHSRNCSAGTTTY